MKVNVKGATPMERLTNITRGLLAVPKADIVRAEKQRQQRKRRLRKHTS